jgi:translation initiation factor IF-2
MPPAKTAPAKASAKPAKSKAGPREKAAPVAKSEPPAKDLPAPKAKAPAVDLLEPVKKVRKPSPDSPLSALPPISKLTALPDPLPPPPAPEPEPEPEDAAAAPADGDSEEKVIQLKTPVTVKELAPLIGQKPFQIIKDLMDLQIFANVNQTLDLETIAKLCEKAGYVLERERKDTSKGHHKVEVKIEEPAAPEQPQEEALRPRAPIVTFMGHVDHGKTSLLDCIRKARVASGEAGGITQHIGAYSVRHAGHTITFLDTPGHAAFTAMRARGATVTDIVVLVVAADDGLMPQTIEAINHARAANVTIIVAINKIDLPSANPDRVKTQLQEHNLAPEDWGGSTLCCPVSATKGEGVDHLLEMIGLQAEMLELKADPRSLARGTVIETQIEQGRGPTVTAIVRMGTLKVGDPFICGNHWGKIKQIIDDAGRPVKKVGPGLPAKILGFSGLPSAGDELVVMESERAARLLGEDRLEALRTNKLAAPRRPTLENLFDNIAEGQKPALRIVLKGDVHGSVEALSGALADLPQQKISLNIIHAAVGPVTESDVLLAGASEAVIVGFGVKVENTALTASKREGVQIKLYSIIYELIDQVKEAMAGLLEPELRETTTGHAEVRQVFDLSKGRVAGCYVTDGRIVRSARARVLRKKQAVYDGGINTLRRFQDEVKEVRNGLECGIRLGDFSDYMVDDIIECYTLEKVPQQL